jgi:DNA-binding transcriptional ArsR family regulator
MDVERFQKAAAALSNLQGLALVSAMKDGEWHIASEVAARAEVHTSTATKHLSALQEAGVLERRETRAKTGRTFAYRLPSPRITLSLDVGDEAMLRQEDAAQTTMDFIAASVRRAESLGWKGIGRRVQSVLRTTFPHDAEQSSEDDWETCLHRILDDGERTPDERLVAVLRAVRAAFENAMGSIASERVFLACLKDVESGPALERISADLFYREGVTS